MEYVQERASQYELKKTLHVWQRKVEIAEVRVIYYNFFHSIIVFLDDSTYIPTDVATTH